MLPSYNGADPAAAAWWQAGQPQRNDIWQEMLRKYVGAGGGNENSQPGWAAQVPDSDFQMGRALHNDIWGDDKKQEDGMQAMLMQLMSSYGGGGY